MQTKRSSYNHEDDIILILEKKKEEKKQCKIMLNLPCLALNNQNAKSGAEDNQMFRLNPEIINLNIMNAPTWKCGNKCCHSGQIPI